MNVSLTPELEVLVAEKVKTGMYQTSSEVIREGLRLLKERDEQVEALRRDVREGFTAVARGEYTDYDANSVKQLAEKVRERGRARVAKTGNR